MLNIILLILGLIGICLVISKKSTIFGLILSCCCVSILTFYNTDSYLNWVDSQTMKLVRGDTTFVHDTVYRFSEPMIFNDQVDTTLPEEPNDSCECDYDEEETELDSNEIKAIKEVIKSYLEKVETHNDSVLQNTTVDTLEIYTTDSTLTEFHKLIQHVIDSLETMEDQV